jgi:hypothetical protein
MIKSISMIREIRNNYKKVTIYAIFSVIVMTFLHCDNNGENSKQREDRISVRLKSNSNLICIETDSTNKLSYEILYPQQFDFKYFNYNEPCTFKKINKGQYLLEIGNVAQKTLYSYIIIDSLKNQNTFYHLSERNTSEGRWWFNYGSFLNTQTSFLDFRIFSDSTVLLSLDIVLKRPLYKKEDISMSSLVDYANHEIKGCIICKHDESTINRVKYAELEYLNRHIDAIPNIESYKRNIAKRLSIRGLQ